MKTLSKLLVTIIGLALLGISQVQAFGHAEEPSKVTFYHHDALGSVIATSNENGEMILSEEYQPYGEKIYLAADSNGGNEDWFTGKNYSRELDLTYFGARWYDAKQGRFLSMDPVGVKFTSIHSFNRYHYANNNPYKYVDPDGEAAAIFLIIGVAASTAFTINNAINAYSENSSVTDTGISTSGAIAAGKSLAIDSALAAVTLGVFSSARVLLATSKGAGKEIGILGDAAKGKGNFGLGSGTRAEADKLGQAWVGNGYEVASDGKTLISKDRLKQYRPPAYKPKLDKTQANFERRLPNQQSNQWQSNGHLDIED